MNLQEIQVAATAAMSSMDSAYSPEKGKKVFDEVLLVHIVDNLLQLDWYKSPRSKQVIETELDTDCQLIREEITQGDHSPGSFHFDNNARGSVFDAFICIGSDQYLVFNNITLSMEEVKREGNWIAAQTHFSALAAKFNDPNLEAWLAQF